ncbi:hypothetical protein ACLESO_08530 [Pyxidicoccus sp. 3LG]
MPGYLLTRDSTVQCGHGAPARAVPMPQRVQIGGQPVVVLSMPYSVSGCPNMLPPPPPPGTPQPCTTAKWIDGTGTTRVTTMGLPLVLSTSQSVCAPTGSKATPVQWQTRVQGI